MRHKSAVGRFIKDVRASAAEQAKAADLLRQVEKVSPRSESILSYVFSFVADSCLMFFMIRKLKSSLLKISSLVSVQERHSLQSQQNPRRHQQQKKTIEG